MKLLKQCSLDGVTRRKDKSLKISFITSLEQSSNELMEVDKLLDSNGILYYKDSEGLSTDEINQIDKVVLDKGKEPTKEQFAEFYQKYTEKYIQYIKDQLN
jgi:hypothetical protein